MLNNIKPPIPFSLYANEIVCPSGAKVRLKPIPRWDMGPLEFPKVLLSLVESINNHPITINDINNMRISDAHYLRQVIDKRFDEYPVRSFVMPSGKHITLYENTEVHPEEIKDITEDEVKQVIHCMVQLIDGQELTMDMLRDLSMEECKVIVFHYLKLNWKGYETPN